jgi:hypothetical protein
MKLELIRDDNNNLSGYKIIRETEDELEAIEMVRDMYFWGHLGKLKYGGRCSEPGTDNTMELKFVTQEYADQQKEKINRLVEEYKQQKLANTNKINQL